MDAVEIRHADTRLAAMWHGGVDTVDIVSDLAAQPYWNNPVMPIVADAAIIRFSM